MKHTVRQLKKKISGLKHYLCLPHSKMRKHELLAYLEELQGLEIKDIKKNVKSKAKKNRIKKIQSQIDNMLEDGRAWHYNHSAKYDKLVREKRNLLER